MNAFYYNSNAMRELVNIRASETMGQEELVSFLKKRFPKEAKRVGRTVIPGTESVQIRVPSNSDAFREIRAFIRAQKNREPYRFVLNWLVRKYTKAELEAAEALVLTITSHMEPCGEECGTVYETLCPHCNAGRQASELVLDLTRAPGHSDIIQTIAQTEWIVSDKLARALQDSNIAGVEFRPVLSYRKPFKQSPAWRQLWITALSSHLSDSTHLGKDALNSTNGIWRCPLSHSILAQSLSEVRIERKTFQSTDISATSTLFGIGENLVRPSPLIIVSQKFFRVLCSSEARGYSVERAILV